MASEKVKNIFLNKWLTVSLGKYNGVIKEINGLTDSPDKIQKVHEIYLEQNSRVFDVIQNYVSKNINSKTFSSKILSKNKSHSDKSKSTESKSKSSSSSSSTLHKKTQAELLLL